MTGAGSYSAWNFEIKINFNTKNWKLILTLIHMDINLYGFIFSRLFLSLQLRPWEPFLSENSQSQEARSEDEQIR